MNANQYTIRRINPALDKKLRRLAKASNRSLNEVVLDTLQAGLGMQSDELTDVASSLRGLAAFDQASKKPSKLDPNVPIKELYNESLAKKYITK